MPGALQPQVGAAQGMAMVEGESMEPGGSTVLGLRCIANGGRLQTPSACK